MIVFPLNVFTKTCTAMVVDDGRKLLPRPRLDLSGRDRGLVGETKEQRLHMPRQNERKQQPCDLYITNPHAQHISVRKHLHAVR